MADDTEIVNDAKRVGTDGAGRSSPSDGTTSTPQRKIRRSPRRLILLLLVLAIVAAGAAVWWIRSEAYENTDDAQVNAHLSAISSRVAGTVTAVYVEENQFVKVGQPIADLDPRDYQNTLDQAQSQLLQAEAQVRAVDPNVPITETSNRASVSIRKPISPPPKPPWRLWSATTKPLKPTCARQKPTAPRLSPMLPATSL